MRIFLNGLIPVLLIMFISCGSTMDATSPGDRTLVSKLRKYSKKSGDAALEKELTQLYEEAVLESKARVSAYELSADLGRYDRLLDEYRNMQRLSDLIRDNGAYNLLKPENYLQRIEQTRKDAAEAWYQKGEERLAQATREGNREAYSAFRKSGQYVSGYRDSQQRMRDAFNRSIVNIVITKLESDSYLYPGWNTMFSNDNMVENLVRDLGGNSASQAPARLYSERDARYFNVKPDWIINLRIRNGNIPSPQTNRYNRALSKSIRTGTDSSGKPVYETVRATLQITRRYIRSTGNLEYRITEWESKRQIAWDQVSMNYEISEESATYTGDSRALSSEDWDLVNRNNNRPSDYRDFSEEMLKRAYPDLRSRLKKEIDW